ncbi:MAG: winged helix-turn-helix transcriptional regulator [Frankia sp.]
MSAVLLLTNTPDLYTGAFPALGRPNHVVHLAPLEANTLPDTSHADVVLVDAREKLVVGRGLCRRLRAAGIITPLLATVMEGGLAAVSADWGIDDVILDTAGPAEVDARLRLAINRDAKVNEVPVKGVIESGDLVIDETTRIAKLGDRKLRLTNREFEVLAYLARHAGQVFTRAQLLRDVWGYSHHGVTRTVDCHIRRIRVKLGTDRESMISTVHKVGYTFVPAAQVTPAPTTPTPATSAPGTRTSVTPAPVTSSPAKPASVTSTPTTRGSVTSTPVVRAARKQGQDTGRLLVRTS